MATGRRCTVCSLPTLKLLEMERAIHGGTIRVSQLARIHDVSVDAIYRHQRNHAQLELRVETPESETLPVAAELVERLIESADDLRRARHVASMNNNILSLTRAADSEAKVLSMLMDRLGIDATETNETLKFHNNLITALVVAVRKSPEIGHDIADAFRRDKRDEEAEPFDRLADMSEARLKEREVIS